MSSSLLNCYLVKSLTSKTLEEGAGEESLCICRQPLKGFFSVDSYSTEVKRNDGF